MSRYGVGTIDTWTLASGQERHRARVFADGKHKTIKICDSRAEAEAALAGAAEAREAGTLRVEGDTLRTFGVGFLARRIANGGRNAKTDASRWSRHILTAPFVDWPLARIAPKHVALWIDKLASRRAADRRGKRPISPQTIRHVVALLRRALQLALQRGLVSINAAAGHELPQVRKDTGWTYLLPEEIARLTTCEAIPFDVRTLVAFAIWTGLRQGELYTLRLQDVHLDDDHPHVMVMFGKPGKPPKNGRIRRVELFEEAATLTRSWLAQLDEYTRDPKNDVSRNPAGILFPTRRGNRRRDGKAPRGWSKSFHLDPAEKLPRGVAKSTAKTKRAMLPSYLARAGLGDPKTRHDGRAVRWHDLRHTCGAALISGWWGRRWRLEEVKEHLGHTSINVTSRYAHLAPGVMAQAARETGKQKGTER
jgi:integrase